MVGYTLRQERERQNLTVEDIEQGTSIRAVYIEAIEAGEYDKLPGAIYTKGFIKNYAKFLSMDADAVAKEFANDMAELKAEEEAEAAKADAEAQAQAEQNIEVKPAKPEKKSIGYSIRQEDSGFPKKLIAAAVVLIAVIAGGLGLWMSGSDGNVAKVDPPAQTQQPVEPAPPEAENPATPVANAATPPASDSVNVQARFNSRCWALVTVDGAVVEEGIIEGGQTLSWEGKDNITFRLGNAGAVEFFQDGKSLGVTGAEGDVVDKTFTRK